MEVTISRKFISLASRILSNAINYPMGAVLTALFSLPMPQKIHGIFSPLGTKKDLEDCPSKHLTRVPMGLQWHFLGSI